MQMHFSIDDREEVPGLTKSRSHSSTSSPESVLLRSREASKSRRRRSDARIRRGAEIIRSQLIEQERSGRPPRPRSSDDNPWKEQVEDDDESNSYFQFPPFGDAALWADFSEESASFDHPIGISNQEANKAFVRPVAQEDSLDGTVDGWDREERALWQCEGHQEIKRLQSPPNWLDDDDDDDDKSEEQKSWDAASSEDRSSRNSSRHELGPSLSLKEVYQDPHVCVMALPDIRVTSTALEDYSSVLSPASREYATLAQDLGFRHAQGAGFLWQSLVGQHVRFPSTWWGGASTPPLGVAKCNPPIRWDYLGRHRVRQHDYFESLVPHRGSAGRLLLHVIVRDLLTGTPVLDLAVGCFHPNARGIRSSDVWDPSLENSRDIWLAVRRKNAEVSLVESLLSGGLRQQFSPIGQRHSVNNENVRAVFGDTPPLETVFVVESDLYEILSAENEESPPPPAAILLEYYLRDTSI